MAASKCKGNCITCLHCDECLGYDGVIASYDSKLIEIGEQGFSCPAYEFDITQQ